MVIAFDEAQEVVEAKPHKKAWIENKLRGHKEDWDVIRQQLENIIIGSMIEIGTVLVPNRIQASTSESVVDTIMVAN